MAKKFNVYVVTPFATFSRSTATEYSWACVSFPVKRFENTFTSAAEFLAWVQSVGGDKGGVFGRYAKDGGYVVSYHKSEASARKAAEKGNSAYCDVKVLGVFPVTREKPAPVVEPVVEAPKAAAIVEPAPAPAPKAPAKAAKAVTREEWLNKALHGPIAKLLAAHGATVPADCRVSIGFPGGGSARKRIGECWPRSRSKDGVNEVFINPTIAAPSQLLDILVHEAIHAADDCKSGHKGFFAKTAKAVGLAGKMTATTAGPELKVLIERWIAQLPALTHGALDISGRKKQGTRMLLLQCPCGCKARMTAKWLDEVGAPTCGCGHQMVAL